jgi:hypothetical protein
MNSYKLSSELKKAIRTYQRHGDLTKIADSCGFAVNTVRYAIKHKTREEEVYNAIVTFYEDVIPKRIEKEALLDKALNITE